MGKQRVEYFDTLKGFFIVFIVFVHYVTMNGSTVMGNITMIFTASAIPCFMMVSGALMHSSSAFNWKKYLSKLAWIYGAFVAWRAFYFVVHHFVSGVSCSPKQLFSYLFFASDIYGVNTDVMWYIISYIMVLFLYPVTWHLFRTAEGKKVLLFVLALLFFSGILLPTCTAVLQVMGVDTQSIETVKTILPFINQSHMIFYFILGAFLFEYREKTAEIFKSRRYLSFIMVAVGLGSLLLFQYLTVGTIRFDGFYLTPWMLIFSTSSARALWRSVFTLYSHFITWEKRARY